MLSQGPAAVAPAPSHPLASDLHIPPGTLGSRKAQRPRVRDLEGLPGPCPQPRPPVSPQESMAASLWSCELITCPQRRPTRPFIGSVPKGQAQAGPSGARVVGTVVLRGACRSFHPAFPFSGCLCPPHLLLKLNMTFTEPFQACRVSPPWQEKGILKEPRGARVNHTPRGFDLPKSKAS